MLRERGENNKAILQGLDQHGIVTFAEWEKRDFAAGELFRLTEKVIDATHHAVMFLNVVVRPCMGVDMRCVKGIVAVGNQLGFGPDDLKRSNAKGPEEFLEPGMDRRLESWPVRSKADFALAG